ncbi:hypothetical protein JHK82_028586 [Glycine max]|uniref:Uncharacterized protein n=1 Tax=Glycine soja TaxID=3848 RepID=A0A0B2RFT1_GLYSO|nr:uncharacterized protein LOC102664513 [Glycine max]XP_006589295.1 uncharacterized protein LOC102664513 [Glycine max]XP_014618756.1 uncharacterized protein LOC102664513 [Glycine max]XP_028182681.1 uncharacterized protein LOC114369647 [Glycine soja]XP_028182682.1 uncharacterized protein LOC114369647 [Glycine soja]XP_028182683.1 uncharacterized protein LOC114369647 [Glycine soja]KAG4397662.1 hypothetical protein GLYMA_10G188000v4 [Glycine max]KAG4397663.1 hypothetical protein GLYMA_10G188000v|eukprot:XP_006589294.1 uncharacterized protein LOC102664513 [Glycine max]
MSKAFSSKKYYSSLPPPPTPITAATSRAKKRQSPRSPLQDLNRISSSSNSSYASSSVSTEAPKGCLRFLSSSSFRTPVHRPKSLTKTPSSAPRAAALKQSKSNSSKENLPKGNAGLRTKTLASDKMQMTHKKNPPCLYQWQSGKKSGSRTGRKSNPCSAFNEHGKRLPRLPSASEELKEKEDILGGRNDNAGEHDAHVKLGCGAVNLTPSSKKVAGSYLEDIRLFGDVEENPNSSASRTPPIHNSLSPEIQCGSSLVPKTATPACYGAGYVVSGVADKRKCRPRGILTVEKNYSGSDKIAANSFDDDDDDARKKVMDTNDHASPSLLPLPTEAVVHWLSSPCNKGKKILSKEFENGLNQSQGLAESTTLASSTSPSSSSKTFWNVSDSSDLSGGANGIMRKISSSISPNGLAEFQVPSDYILSPSHSSLLFSPNPTPICRAGSSGKGKTDQYNLIDENSPFSLNSFGSGNVIQTPQSDSSSVLHVGLSLAHADNRKEDISNPGLNSSSKILLSENLLLNSSMPLEDSVNSSFQFDCLTMPCESIDLSKLPNFLDGQDPWLSSSTIENASQSQMRISWREGLMSQSYELDEFDCCRCLSDEEEEIANESGTNRFSGPQVNIETNDGKKLNSDVGITETEDTEQEIHGLDKEKIPALMSCSGAESISTDGGGLVASGDSDWTLCHVNKSFEV